MIMYKIKILNWDRHNQKAKKSFKKTMISNNFCHDNKLIMLPIGHRWFFLALLLCCGNEARDTIEMSHKQLRMYLERCHSVDRVLQSLESIRVLTFEKCSLIEEKLKERKLKEVKRREENSEVQETPPPAQTATAVDRGIIPEFEADLSISDLISRVTMETQRAWLLAYPSADWIIQEVKKANVWIIANPKRAPKKFGVFMSNWLSRSFENYRKGIPTRRMTSGEVNQMALSDLYEKVKRGEA